MPKWAYLDGNGILGFSLGVLGEYKRLADLRKVISLRGATQVKTPEELKVSPVFEPC
jgi:hypothetical protein